MQAIILAGGQGTRLRPLTYEYPKPMIPINGKPFLQYLLERLKTADITDIILLVGYLGDKIEEYFRDGERFGLHIGYSYEKEILGTAGAVKNVEHKLAEEFLLLNGDTFLPIDYKKLIEYFNLNNTLGVIVAYSNADKIMPNNITVDHLNFVIGYHKKDSSCATHVDAGTAIFKKEAFTNITQKQACSDEGSVYNKLIKNRELLAYITNQRFYDMGSFEGLKKIKDILP